MRKQSQTLRKNDVRTRNGRELSSRQTEIPAETDFEKALKAQRERHKAQGEQNAINTSPIVPVVTPGLYFDETSGRYFKKSRYRTGNINPTVKHKNPSTDHGYKPIGSNISTSLHLRETSLTYKFKEKCLANLLKFNFIPSIDNDVCPPEEHDICSHPISGLAYAIGTELTLVGYHRRPLKYTISEVPSRIRLQWCDRGGFLFSHDPDPFLAALMTVRNGFELRFLKWDKEGEMNFGSSTCHDHTYSIESSDRGSSSGSGSGDGYGTIWNMDCSGSGNGKILLCCDIGLASFDKQQGCIKHCFRLDTPVVMTCPWKGTGANNNESCFATGARNGNLYIADLRSKRPFQGNNIGSLPFCCDHIYCSTDNVSVMAQDVLSSIRIYDVRKPGKERMRVIEAPTGPGSDAKIRHRRFWTSETGKYVVASQESKTGVGIGVWSTISHCTQLKYHDVLGMHQDRLVDRLRLSLRRQHQGMKGPSGDCWVKLCGNGNWDGDGVGQGLEEGGHRMRTDMSRYREVPEGAAKWTGLERDMGLFGMLSSYDNSCPYGLVWGHY
eukprot:gene9133-18922_t